MPISVVWYSVLFRLASNFVCSGTRISKGEKERDNIKTRISHLVVWYSVLFTPTSNCVPSPLQWKQGGEIHATSTRFLTYTFSFFFQCMDQLVWQFIEELTSTYIVVLILEQLLVLKIGCLVLMHDNPRSTLHTRTTERFAGRNAFNRCWLLVITGIEMSQYAEKLRDRIARSSFKRLAMHAVPFMTEAVCGLGFL